MKISFLGAAGTVTGSKYLIESQNGNRILIDCGLFQGPKNLRLRNWDKFSVNPKTISAVILTHAHVDHSGYLPKLVREGFHGEIYSTPATHALAEIILKDSAKLKEEDAEYANRKAFSKHQPALPLYTSEDVERCMKLFRSKNIKEDFHVGDFSIRFNYAGHILGAASVRIEGDGKSVIFSGDLGRYDDVLMYEAAPPMTADYMVIESTYGDRLHDVDDPISALLPILEDALEKKSVLLIPSFAVGRTQNILFCFYKLFAEHPRLRIPLYVNSPMADSATNLYEKFHKEHKLDKNQCNTVFNDALFIQDIEQSKALNLKSGPMVIIAGSGMVSGGRILHHLQAFGNNPQNKILLVGFQASGTRGAALEHGEKSIKFHGYYHPIEAEVIKLDMFSAHADQKDLLEWIKSGKEKPQKIFITHGEPHASDTLRRKIEEELQIPAETPIDGQIITL